MSSFYISPTGSGDHSGSSWENAATIKNLGSLIDKAHPNDQILLRADQGSYHVTSQIAIHAGGSEGKPITIRGVNGSGHSEQAVITGNRSADYPDKGSSGNELFKLLDGADNLKFRDLAIKNVGAAFRFGANVSHITIDNVDAQNVSYFVNDLKSGGASSASVDKLTIRNVDISGFSDKAIFLTYDTHGVKIQNVTADMAGQIGEKYPEGVHLSGTVHDVLIEDTTMRNVQSKAGTDNYWNGDGFATERDVHDIRFVNTTSVGNTDGGYDLKSSDTVLTGAVAEGNTRNYRFWGTAELIDSNGYDPHKHGGSSQQNQIWIADTADLTVKGGTFSDSSKATIPFVGSGGDISFDDVTTYHAEGTRLAAYYGAHVAGLGQIDDHIVYPGSLSHDLI